MLQNLILGSSAQGGGGGSGTLPTGLQPHRTFDFSSGLGGWTATNMDSLTIGTEGGSPVMIADFTDSTNSYIEYLLNVPPTDQEYRLTFEIVSPTNFGDAPGNVNLRLDGSTYIGYGQLQDVNFSTVGVKTMDFFGSLYDPLTMRFYADNAVVYFKDMEVTLLPPIETEIVGNSFGFGSLEGWQSEGLDDLSVSLDTMLIEYPASNAIAWAYRDISTQVAIFQTYDFRVEHNFGTWDPTDAMLQAYDGDNPTTASLLAEIPMTNAASTTLRFQVLTQNCTIAIQNSNGYVNRVDNITVNIVE